MTDARKPPKPNPKKSETLEVRLPYETKRDFLDACRQDGTTASEVVRGSIQTYLDARERPVAETQTGKLIHMIPTSLRKKRYLAGAAGALGLAMFAAMPSAAAPDFRAVFTKLDRNGDGVLTAEEFGAPPSGATTVRVERRLGPDEAPPPGLAAKGGPVMTDEAVAFWLPEGVGAGKVDSGQGDLVLAQRREVRVVKDGETAPANEDFRPNPFSGFDADADGKVSFDEFQAAHTAMLERGFRKLDASGDGSLSAEEYAAIGAPRLGLPDDAQMRADGPALSPDAIKAAFAKLDKDRNGKVSLAEYMPPA
jgi:Ca2+-binding EF-hand superfamily protein